MQPRTKIVKFARSPCTDRPGGAWVRRGDQRHHDPIAGALRRGGREQDRSLAPPTISEVLGAEAAATFPAGNTDAHAAD